MSDATPTPDPPGGVSLVIAIPTHNGFVPMDFTKSFAMLACSLIQNSAELGGGLQAVRYDIQQGANLLRNREQLARRAVDEGATHLLFLDDDMSFDPDFLRIFLSRKQAVVCANCTMKKVPLEFTAIGFDGQKIPTTAESTGLQAAAVVGLGACLIATEVFKAVPQPWFMPHFSAEDSSYSPEDYAFFERVRAAGYEVWIDHDASKLFSHVGLKAWSWTG